MAIPSKNVLGNPNVTEGNFQIAIEQLRESVIGSGKTYDSANTYMVYDICYYGGVVYYSKIDSNIGNTPSIGANWGDYTDLLLGVVHKIGDETIAGVKTFSSNTIFNGNVRIGDTSDNSTRRLDFITNGGGSSAIESVTIGSTNQELVFKTTYAIESEKMRLTGQGSLLLTSGTGVLGYGTGSGGTVTQLTSKSTTVTLNKPSGQITMNNAALAAGASAAFTFYNSLFSATDILSVSGEFSSGASQYRFEAISATGNAFIRVTNLTAVTLSDALIINFAIIKGANA